MSSNNLNPIGGFFEIHIEEGIEFYPDLKRLNLGRNCLKYILLARGYQKIYLPYYTCESVIKSVKELKVEIEYYDLSYRLEPFFDFEKIKQNEVFLYTNYFGLKDLVVQDFCGLEINLIMDNSQAFFSTPIHGIDTFYSPRKFFGVPDGGYLSTDIVLNMEMKEDVSEGRLLHLYKRKELGPELAYIDFKQNEERLNNLGISYMSAVTKKLLQSINYKNVAIKRHSNFEILHHAFNQLNQLKIEFNAHVSPLAYPLLIDNENLREELLVQKIFVPYYWPNVLIESNKNLNSYWFAKNIIPLPIDQRYGADEMNRIIKIVERVLA